MNRSDSGIRSDAPPVTNPALQLVINKFGRTPKVGPAGLTLGVTGDASGGRHRIPEAGRWHVCKATMEPLDAVLGPVLLNDALGVSRTDEVMLSETLKGRAHRKRLWKLSMPTLPFGFPGRLKSRRTELQ